MLNGLILWQCSKQAVCALSTTEAEHCSCSESGQDVLWTAQLLACLSRPFNQTVPTPTLYCDNQGAIALLENPLYQHRTRHIDVHLHWLRHHVSEGDFQLVYVPTSDNIADGTTKNLSPILARKFLANLHLVSLNKA